jgi:VWA domain-containing protein
MIEFLAPLGWLVACAALIPAGAAVVRGRRDERVRRLLGLDAPTLGVRVGTSVAAVLALALLAASAARPAVRTSATQRVRTDAQVFIVVDVSRSMLARRPGGATRFVRAKLAAERLASALRDVPVGIASLTDRPLPHVFPTTSHAVISAVLHRSLGIQRPPPEAGGELKGRATAFDPLIQLATAGYFSGRAKHRLVILLTDGESGLYTPDAIVRQLRAGHVGLLVLRFWRGDERIYTRGRVETYRPDPGSLRPLETMTAGSVGLYEEGEFRQAVRAARSWLGGGPARATERTSRLELSPYVALAAVFPLAFILWRRDP